MKIDLHGPSEQMIRDQIATGRFTTPEEVVACALAEWINPEATDLEERIRRSGIKPFTGVKSHVFSENEEELDEFLTELRKMRSQDSGRMERLP